MKKLLTLTAVCCAATATVSGSPAFALSYEPIRHATSSLDGAMKWQHSDPDDWEDDDDDDDRWERRRYRGDRYHHGRYRYDDERVYRDTRVWRGRDGRVYCRKNDGTTGLIVGGALGAVLGREIDSRGDRSLGTILGAAGGAILGREIERGRCR